MSNGEVISYEKKDFDPFKAMDALDDELIIAEIEGRIVDKWAYHFFDGKKDVWGLSKVGVDMASRELAKQGEVIREEDVIWEVDPTDARFVLFKGTATRSAVDKNGQRIELDRVVGTKRQCIFIVTKEEGITNRANPFWYEQGAMKCLRNAKQRLLSEELSSKIIAMAKEKGKTKDINTKPPISPPQTKKTEEVSTAAEYLEGQKESPEPENELTMKVANVMQKSGGTKEKPWTRYTVFIGNQTYSTFDKKLAETAKKAKELDMPVQIEYKETEKYGKELVAISLQTVLAEDTPECEQNPDLCGESKYDDKGQAYCGNDTNNPCKYQKQENLV